MYSHESQPDVGDLNVERLVGASYKPDVPDPEFVKSIHNQMRAAARILACPPASAEAERLERLRRRLGFAMTLGLGCAACALFVLAGHRPAPIAPNIPKKSAAVEEAHSVPKSAKGIPWTGQVGLGTSARPRPASPAAMAMAVGTELATKLGEKRRVLLADGSVLFVNQDTRVRYVAERQLKLLKGEVYIEVAPRPAGKDGATFLVQAPDREVSALGTRFGVCAKDAHSSVLVTQGKVHVSGLESLVHAGQQLAPGSKEPAACPRAAHALEWTRDLVIAAESPLVPCSPHTGGVLLAVDPQGQQMRLSLRQFHVDVHIEDGFARTTIDQTYFNHEWSRLEGTFYFPLPPDATLSRLAMYVKDGSACRLMEGGMAERDHARNVFETILHMKRDPALLEWVDGSTFKMRVFPLEPREEKRLILSYTQKLATLYGTTRYRFPAGHNLDVVGDWSFLARVKNGARLRGTSDSHPDMTIQADGSDLVLSAKEKTAILKKDVSLIIHDDAKAAASEDVARLSSCTHEGAQYLMLRYRPRMAAPPKRERRDWVFLFEASAMRDPLLARVQIDVIKTLLENAEHNDTFTIVAAGTRVHLFDSKARPATAANVKEALKFLEGVHLVGALDLGQALAAVEPTLASAKNPHLVHLGSGIATIGQRRDDLLVKKIPHGVRYVGVAVGKRWSRSFMKMAADATGGMFTQINPDEPVNWRAFELSSTLNTPRMVQVHVVDNDEKIQFLCDATTLSQGEEICAIARIDLGKSQRLPKTIVFAGTLDGKQVVREINVEHIAYNAGYLPRQWAKLEIERLLAEDAEKHKARIIGLSMWSYVMTPYTSLLVLETEADYAKYHVDRGRKDHWAMYACPDRIPLVYEPNPGNTAQPASSAGKADARQVLDTIMVRIPPQLVEYAGQPNGTVPSALTVGQMYHGVCLVSEDQTIEEWLDVTSYRHKLLMSFDDVDRRTNLNLPGQATGDTSFKVKIKTGDKLRPIEDLLDKRLTPGLENVFTKQKDGRSTGTQFQPGGGFGQSQGLLGPLPPATKQPPALRLPGGKGGMGGTMSGPRGMMGLDSNGGMGGIMGGGSMMSGMGGIMGGGDMMGGMGGMMGGKDLAPGLQGLNFGIEFRFLDEEDKKRLKDKEAKNSESTKTLKSLQGWLVAGGAVDGLLYKRPTFKEDARVFGDLVWYAPGLNTTAADIHAVLEAEATPDPRHGPGQVDPAARKLVGQARQAGWCRLTVPADGSQPSFVVYFNGAGQFAWDHLLACGLREQVTCDGKTLWHLYPEIGLGAKRVYGRGYHAVIAEAVPWLLPCTDDLARGTDVLLVEPGVVGLQNRGADKARDADGQPVPYLQLRLVFGGDGRLIERRIVQMPDGKLLSRQCCDADGTVRILDASDKEVSQIRLQVAAAEAPSLAPKTNQLVIVPMPLRTPHWLLRNQTVKSWPAFFAQLDENAAIALMAAHCAQREQNLAQMIFAVRFHGRGDKRLGFYVLLASGGFVLDPAYGYQAEAGGKQQFFDVVSEHPKAPLAMYLAYHFDASVKGHQCELGDIGGKEDGLVQRLAGFRDLYVRSRPPRAMVDRAAARAKERQDTLKYLGRSPLPILDWALLMKMLQSGAAGDPDVQKAMAEVCKVCGQGLGYVARYELARELSSAGHVKLAQQQFRELYLQTLEQGAIGPLDRAFVDCLNTGEGTCYADLMREAAGILAKRGQASHIVGLAWQAHRLGDARVADEMMSQALAVCEPGRERSLARLAVVQYLVQTQQFIRAEAMLQLVLTEEPFKQSPALWRWSAQLAGQRSLTARSVACLDQALDLEFRDLPPVINLQEVRSDYMNLLQQYQQVANATAILERDPPREFIAKVVRAADRWRALDPEPGEVCRITARILQSVGAHDLAWDYMTTPIGLRPNEAAPWLQLAETLRGEGSFDLADRAYALAFEAESTNAQILWDRAQNLFQAGRVDDGLAVYRDLAAGQWQARFQGLQSQAKQRLQQR